MKLCSTKFLIIIAIIFLSIIFILIFSIFNIKKEINKSKFYGSKTFDFCGEDLKKHKGCEKFCEELTGVNCETRQLKTDEFIKGRCYYEYPQSEADGCEHCSIICTPL